MRKDYYYLHCRYFDPIHSFFLLCLLFFSLIISDNAFGQLLNESFDNGALPSDWRMEHITGTTDWNVVIVSEDGSVFPRSGAGMVQFYDEQGAVTKLITPAMNLSGLSNPILRFYYNTVSRGNHTDSLKLYYNSGGGATWFSLGSIEANGTSSWEAISVLLPSPGSDYSIAFEGSANDGYGLMIDDVVVYDAVIVDEGWCEAFGVSSVPSWTILDVNNDGSSWMSQTDYADPQNQMMGIETENNLGNNDDYLISPALRLTGNEVLKFSYKVMDGNKPNDFQVLLSNSGIGIANFQDTLMHLASYINTEFKDTSVSLAAYSGNVYIAFHVPFGGLDGLALFIDDVCIEICTPVSGTDGNVDLCLLDGSVDLNTLIVPGQSNGNWFFDADQSLINGSVFDFATLSAGTYVLQYIVSGACTNDTTLAMLSLHDRSNAGDDGALLACRNEPLQLFDALSVNADLGGKWYNSNMIPVPDGVLNASNFGGQYHFYYVVESNYCPNDTALIALTIQGCNYLSTEEFSELEAIVIYPNPVKGILNIGTGEMKGFLDIKLTDLNGRMIFQKSKTLNRMETTQLDFSEIEKGFYLLQLYNETSSQTFRILLE